MRRTILFISACLLLYCIFPIGEQIAQEHSQLGGRPGEFHFILKDQADSNRAQFRTMQVRIDRMRADVLASATDEATRSRLIADLNQIQLFVASMETQLSLPVGQTAGDVEQRLNLVKGQANCATCHEDSAVRAAR